MNLIDGNAVAALFAAQDAEGSGTAVYFAGGDALLEVDGTWGGTTFTLQRSRDGKDGTFRDLDSSVSLTANGSVVVTLPPGWLRGVLTGGAGMSITAALQRIPQ